MATLEFKVFAAFDQLLPDPTKTLVVGVSGGADSMALTLLASAYAKLKGYGLQAVTIDHQLRPESTAEAQVVGQTLASVGIAHQTLIWNHDGNVNRRHERARAARYQLLVDFCKLHHNPVLLTAHHKQDQVETILMRFLKGSGPAGFQCVQASRIQDGVAIIRPLLVVKPEELRSYLKSNDISWIEDPSNNDAAYERTRVRQLLTHMSELGWGQDGMLTSAAKVYEQHADFESLIAEYASAFVINDATLTVDQAAFFKCAEPMQRDWLRQQIWQIGGADYPKPHATITAILKMLKQPRVNGYRVAGCVINVDKGRICLMRTVAT